MGLVYCRSGAVGQGKNMFDLLMAGGVGQGPPRW
jgi:hypothetical protein